MEGQNKILRSLHENIFKLCVNFVTLLTFLNKDGTEQNYLKVEDEFLDSDIEFYFDYDISQTIIKVSKKSPNKRVQH